MANDRIYYAVQAVGLQGDSTGGGFTAAHGVQSIGSNTNFDLTQVFELGQLAIYENREDIPDVEITLNKALDGYPLLYHLATVDAAGPTLAERGRAKCLLALAIYEDTQESASGAPPSLMQCSGMYVSSLGYNFPLEDDFNEDLTLVGNDKVWLNDPKPTNPNLPTPSWTPTDFVSNNDSPQGLGGVNMRQDLAFSATNAWDKTILPQEVYGISSSGTNEKTNGEDYDAHITRIACSADLGREELFELGRKAPYFRSITFPIEVTCEIEVTSSSGDMISATEEGIYTTGTAQCEDGGNLVDREIRIATCEGTRIYLGNKNKLASVNYGGGDAGGGNVTVSYTFTTFNDFTVIHSGDPNTNGSAWWAARSGYLTT